MCRGTGRRAPNAAHFCFLSAQHCPRATPTCWARPNLKGWLVGVGAGQGPLDLSLPKVVGTGSVADQTLSASEALRKDSWLRQPGGDRAHSRHGSCTAPPPRAVHRDRGPQASPSWARGRLLQTEGLPCWPPQGPSLTKTCVRLALAALSGAGGVQGRVVLQVVRCHLQGNPGRSGGSESPSPVGSEP